MKIIKHNIDGTATQITTYPNGYRQFVDYDTDGYSISWFDTKGNFQDFEIIEIGKNKKGEPILESAFINSSIHFILNKIKYASKKEFDEACQIS